MAQAIEELLLKITTQVGGAVALSELVTQFVNLNKHAETLHRALTAIEGSSEKADQTFQYLVDSANKYGLGIEQVTNGYTKLAAAAKGTALEGEATKRIFESVSGAMSVLGAESVTTNRAFVALAQMMSKGQIYAEELRGQLAEALPDAIQVMATALGVGTDKLYALMQAGSLGAEVLIPFAEELDKRYGALSKGTGTLSQETNRLKNVFYESAISIEKVSGIYSGITETVAYFAKQGEALATVFSGVVAAAFAKVIQLTITSTSSIIAASTALVEKNAVAKQTAATELQLAESTMLVARATVIEAANTEFAAKVGLNYAYVNLQNAQTAAERAIALEALKIAEGKHAATVIASIQAQRAFDASLTATTAAQTANAAANSLWSRSMSFLAGPGGLLLAAGAAMLYFTSQSSKQKDVTEELSKGIEVYNDKLRAMNQVQLAAEVEKLNISYKNQTKEIDALNKSKQMLIELTATSDDTELLDRIVLKNGEIADAKQKLLLIEEALAVAQIESGKSQEEVFKNLSAQIRERVLRTIELNDKLRESERQTKLVVAANEAEAQSVKSIIELQFALAKASGDIAAIHEIEIANSNRKIELAKIELASEQAKQTEYKNQLDVVRQKIVNETSQIAASEKLSLLTKEEIAGLKSKSVQTQKELLEKELLVAKSEKEIIARKNTIEVLKIEAEAQRLSTSLLSEEFARQEKVIVDAGISISELTVEYNKLVIAGENAATLNGVLNQIKAKQEEAAVAAQAMGNALTSAFKAVGLDYREVANGMDLETKRVIDAFGQLGRFSIVTAKDIQLAFTNVLAKANTDAELKALEEQLIKLSVQGKISGDQLAQSLAAVNTKAVDLRAAVDPLQIAMEKLGIGVPEKLAAAANEAEKLYLTIKNSKAPVDEIQQAFLQYAEKALLAAENGAKIDESQLKAQASALGLGNAFDELKKKVSEASAEYAGLVAKYEVISSMQQKEIELAKSLIESNNERIQSSIALNDNLNKELLVVADLVKEDQIKIELAKQEVVSKEKSLALDKEKLIQLQSIRDKGEQLSATQKEQLALLEKQIPIDEQSIVLSKEKVKQAESQALSYQNIAADITKIVAVSEQELNQSNDLLKSKKDKLEAEKALSIAMGDTTKAQQLGVESAKIDVEIAKNTAQAKRDAAIAVQEYASQLTQQALKDGIVTEEEQKAIDIANKLAEAKRNEASAAEDTATALEKNAEAANKLAEAEKAAAESAAQLKAAGEAAAAVLNAADKAMADTGGNLEKLRKAFNEYSIDSTNALSADPWIAWAAAVANAADDVVRRYNDQKSALEDNVATLQRFASEGGNVAEIQRLMAQYGEGANYELGLLNEQDLSNLRSAMDSANDKLRDMQNEAQDAQTALAEMNAELMAEQGNTAGADRLKLQIEQSQKLADLEQKRLEAERTGNTEAAKTYQEMIRVQEALGEAKRKNLEADIAGNTKTTATNKAAISQAGELASVLKSAGEAAQSLNNVNLSGLHNQISSLGESVNKLRSAL